MSLPKPPVYLDVWLIHLPLPGWVSLIQRLSGTVLFMLLPLMVYLFHLSLTHSGYIQLLYWRQQFFFKVGLIAIAWMYLQHFFAGLRFLLLDVHVGSSLRSARLLSAITFLLSGVSSLIIVENLW